MPRPRIPLKERLEKFTVKPESGDGCWKWIGRKHQFGYGILQVTVEVNVLKVMYSHRLSWQLHVGEIPDGMSVLHRCDNPECTRPDHLFLGTQADNLRDMDQKGRRKKCSTENLRGERSHMAKLTEPQIIEILERYSLGQQPKFIQTDMNLPVTSDAVWRICNRKNWRHITWKPK